MSQARGRAADRTDTRNRILEAAFDVFADRGFHAAALEEIVARAGYTRGAFHSNFESKEELFLAVVERQIETEAEGIDKLLASGVPLLEAVLTDPLPPAKRRRLRILYFEFWLYASRRPKLSAQLKEMTRSRILRAAETIATEVRNRGLTLTTSPEEAANLIFAVNTHIGLQHAVTGVDATRDLFTPLFGMLGLEPAPRRSGQTKI